jgi:hypothetical protein
MYMHMHMHTHALRIFQHLHNFGSRRLWAQTLRCQIARCLSKPVWPDIFGTKSPNFAQNTKKVFLPKIPENIERRTKYQSFLWFIIEHYLCMLYIGTYYLPMSEMFTKDSFEINNSKKLIIWKPQWLNRIKIRKYIRNQNDVSEIAQNDSAKKSWIPELGVPCPQRCECGCQSKPWVDLIYRSHFRRTNSMNSLLSRFLFAPYLIME